jgi:hypothetical protein
LDWAKGLPPIRDAKISFSAPHNNKTGMGRIFIYGTDIIWEN